MLCWQPDSGLVYGARVCVGTVRCLCVLLLRDLRTRVRCSSGNELGAEGGAAVAESMKSCTQLTSLNLQGMPCLWVLHCEVGGWVAVTVVVCCGHVGCGHAGSGRRCVGVGHVYCVVIQAGVCTCIRELHGSRGCCSCGGGDEQL